jgi:membrane-associated protease RseP (regulator of RpoE activity)
MNYGKDRSGAGIGFVLSNVLLLLTIGPLWGGYVLSRLWGWFVVPVLELPPLTWATAYGIALILGLASP